MERTYRGTKEVFFIQIFDSDGELIGQTNAWNVFPSPAEVEKVLVSASKKYGFDVSVKVDRRQVLNFID